MLRVEIQIINKLGLHARACNRHAAVDCTAGNSPRELMLHGAAVCGRPANRNSDDGKTAEVLRLALPRLRLVYSR